MGMRFDPMTGEPLVRFDPMTGKRIREKEKFPKMAKIACCLAVGVIAVIIIAANLLPRILFGKNYKILQAAANTFQANHLSENINAFPTLKSGNYTAAIHIDADNSVEVAMTLANNLPKKQVSLEGTVSVSVIDIGFAAKISDSEMLVSVPDFVDETLRYSYKGEKSDYFEEIIENNFDMDVEEFDNAVKSLVSKKQEESLTVSMGKASMQVIKMLDFEKTDKREFTVDGKDRNCSGYRLQVDGDLISDVCDIYEDAVDESMQGIRNMPDASGMDGKELFDEIRDRFKDVECELSVYLYKKQIAAVVIEQGREEFMVQFCGGSTPWENTIVSVDGEDVMELIGSVQKNVETMRLELQGNEVAEYEYDFKNGDFELRLGGGGHTFAEIEGKILHSGKQYTYEISDIPLGALGSCLVQIQIKKGADTAEIGTKNVLDIGTMSENDWEDLIEEIQVPFMKGFVNGWGILR